MLIACPPRLDEAVFFDSCVVALIVSPLAFGLLTVPATLAVHKVAQSRFAPLLDRGPLERRLVLGASLLGACSAVLHAAGAAAILDRTGNAMRVGLVLLVFIVPAPLGAIPWAAGELVGRESARQGLALACSIVTAYAISLGGFSVLESRFPGVPSPELIALQAAVTPVASLVAALAYIAVRGKALEPAPPEAVALDRMSSVIPAR